MTMPRRAAAVLLLAAAAAAALRAQEPDIRITEPPPPPPIDPALLRPATGDVRTIVRGISFTTSAGVRVRLPYVEVVGPRDALAGDQVSVPFMRLRGASVVLPAPSTSPPGDAGASRSGSDATGAARLLALAGFDPFMPLGRRRIEVGHLVMENGTAAARAPGGEWLWRYHDLDLEARAVALGGRGPERLRIVHAGFRSAMPGDGPADGRLRLDAHRAGGRFTADADVTLGGSRARIRADARRDGALTAELIADTLDFAELHGRFSALPAVGRGSLHVLVTASGDRALTVELRRAAAHAGESTVRARGGLRIGAEGAADDLVIEIPRLLARDFHAAYGVDLPGAEEWRGELRADGPLRSGVRVEADVEEVPAAGRAGGARVAVNGLVRAPARTGAAWLLDLDVDAGPLRLAGESFALDLQLRGPADSLTWAGSVAGAGAPADVTGDAPPIRAGGFVAWRGKRNVAVTVEADSIPARALPLPAPLDAAPGYIAVRARLAGPLSSLRADGRITVLAAPRAPAAAAIELGVLEGTAVLARTGELDLVARADSLPLAVLPPPAGVTDLRGTVDGRIRITGTPDAPAWGGTMRLHGAGLTVPRTRTTVRGLSGTVRVADGAFETDGLLGELGGGRLEVTGGAAVRGPRRGMDVRVDVVRGWLAEADSASVLGSAALRVRGGLRAPLVTGSLDVHEGHVHEDVLNPEGALDLDAPPYSALVERVPWPADSRLRSARSAAATATPRTARPEVRIAAGIEPGFAIIDEDSEMFGTGRLVLRMDTAGVRAEGVYRIEGGEYNNFGERFDLIGGALAFDGSGVRPRVSLRAEHDHGAPLGTGIGSTGRAFDFFPPLEFFALGGARAGGGERDVFEEVRRLSLLPEDQTELGALLIYGQPVEPVTGLRTRRFFQPEHGADLVGERAEAQSAPLLWAYAADEAYDYIPLERGYLRAGTYTVGPRYPAPLTVGGLLMAGARLAPLELELAYPVEGGAWPGVHVRYDAGAFRLTGFNEPRFRARAALGEGRPGYAHQRRTGLRLRWALEY